MSYEDDLLEAGRKERSKNIKRCPTCNKENEMRNGRTQCGFCGNSMNMKRPTHPELVEELAKPGIHIARQLTDDPIQAHLTHMALGVAGEAGEIVDAIKKMTIYGKQLDRENLIEELGDMEWYLEGIRGPLCITREECLEKNIDKLLKRYEGMKYSDKAAQDRADKQPLNEKELLTPFEP